MNTTATQTTPSTHLVHFKSTSEVIRYALEEQRENLRGDLAAMKGSAAERYTEEEVATVEDIMADLIATLNAQG